VRSTFVSRSIFHEACRLLLLAALQAAPVAAVAGLASYDLLGAPRSSPTTMGALEVDTAVAQLPTPTGLTIQRV